MKESHELFKANLQRHHEQLKTLYSSLITNVGAIKNNPANKEREIKNIIQEMISTCNYLQENIISPERPGWINPLKNSCHSYLSKNFDSRSFTEIFNHHANVFSHQWNFETISSGINFDSIYQEYKKNSELPQLLEELIALLEKLMNECGDDLQSKTLNDLNQLLSTVKFNKKGSYGAIQSTLFIVWDFFKTAFFVLYPQVNIANSAIETVLKIEKVLKNANKANEEIGTQVAEKSVSSFKNNFTYSPHGLIEDKSIIPEKVKIDIKE